MHSPFERSHNLTVESPLEVANLLPLFSRKQDKLFKKSFMFFFEPYVHLYIYVCVFINTYICTYIFYYERCVFN